MLALLHTPVQFAVEMRSQQHIRAVEVYICPVPHQLQPLSWRLLSSKPTVSSPLLRKTATNISNTKKLSLIQVIQAFFLFFRQTLSWPSSLSLADGSALKNWCNVEIFTITAVFLTLCWANWKNKKNLDLVKTLVKSLLGNLWVVHLVNVNLFFSSCNVINFDITILTQGSFIHFSR